MTLTTEAPVANFLPSFFEASLSLTPESISRISKEHVLKLTIKTYKMLRKNWTDTITKNESKKQSQSNQSNKLGNCYLQIRS